jgi:hypothetical protein
LNRHIIQGTRLNVTRYLLNLSYLCDGEQSRKAHVRWGAEYKAVSFPLHDG